MLPDECPSPFLRHRPSGNCPCYCGHRRGKRSLFQVTFYPARAPAWSSDRREFASGGIRSSAHSIPGRRRIHPALQQFPGRIHGIRCRRTSGPIRERYLSSTLCDQFVSRLGRGRSPAHPDRTRRLQRRSGCGWRFFQRSARCFCRPAFVFRVRLFSPFLTR